MEKSEHQAADQVWGWTIEHEAPKRKKDRAQAVLYTVAGFHPSSPWGRPSLWTKAEAYALKHDLWIAERTEDQPDALARPAHERPGLLRAVRLVVCAGGLLLEDLNDLGDPLTKAAVVSLFGGDKPRVAEAGRLIGEERARTLVRQAGGPHRVEAAADVLLGEAFDRWTRTQHIQMQFRVGTGEPRDYDAALRYAECLRLAGKGQREIIGRLNLEGYVNQTGVRRWNTHNVPRSS
jgi:hypothetical protein